MLTPSVTREKQHPQSLRAVRGEKAEKKRKYQQRVLDVEMGSFTPLVFGTNGWIGADCKLLSQTPSREALRKE